MTYKQKYSDIKRVYCDLETGSISSKRVTKFQTRFDSTAEYKFFLLLKECFPEEYFMIEVHPTLSIGNRNWNIDFRVSCREIDYASQVILASIVNTVHNTGYRNLREIFFEYKGLQDDNFLAQMQNIAINAPIFATSIILVSVHTSAFGCWDSIRKKFYCHPICSVDIIKQIISIHKGMTYEPKA